MDRKSDGKKAKEARVAPEPLSAGDIVCPKCKGSGWRIGHNDWEYTCDTCWGVGKLDWIERIMGKPNPFPPRTLRGSWTIEMEEDIQCLYDIDTEYEIVDAFSKELAEKIDEEIIGNIVELSVTKSKLT